MARKKAGKLGCGSLVLSLAMAFLAFVLGVSADASEGGITCMAISAFAITLLLLALMKTAATPGEPSRRRGREPLPESFNVRNFQTNLRGVSHYQRAVKRTRDGDKLDLIREPLNPHDEDAVMVQHRRSGETVGYIARHIAKKLARRLDRGDPYRCQVVCRVGGLFQTKGLVVHVISDLDAHIERQKREAAAG